MSVRIGLSSAYKDTKPRSACQEVVKGFGDSLMSVNLLQLSVGAIEAFLKLQVTSRGGKSSAQPHGSAFIANGIFNF